MVRGVAEAARAFGDAELRALAVRNGEFLFRELVRDGRVFRSTRRPARIAGYLEDHAALGLARARGLRADVRPDVARARARARRRRSSRGSGTTARRRFFDTASDHEKLITRPRDVTDNATPSGTSLAVELLLKLGDVLAIGEYSERGRYLLETVAEPMARYPTAFGHALGAADLAVRGAVEVAIAGEPSASGSTRSRERVAERYLPSLVLAGGSATEGIALLEGRGGDEPTAYVCRAYACDAPTSDVRDARGAAGGDRRARLIAPPCGAAHLRSEFRGSSYSFISHVSDVSGLPKVSWTSSRIIV